MNENVAKVIANNGAEVKLGFADGSFRSVPAAEIGFLAPVGTTIDVYQSADGKYEYVQRSGAPTQTVGGANDFSGTVRVNKQTYCILALLLGGLGIHKFYAKKNILGVIYLVFCWTFIPAFVAFVEFIIAITKNADVDGMIEVW